MQTITVMMGNKAEGHCTLNLPPDRATTLLEANRTEETIAVCHCSVQQFLDFILDVQRCAIDAHIATSIDNGDRLDDTSKRHVTYGS